MSTYVIGLDAGGGGGRCLLLDVHTGNSVTATRPWRFETAPGTGGLGFDLDLPLIWQRLSEATHETLERAGASPGDVLGIAATAVRLGNVMLDANGDALFAVPNRDARAVGPGIMLGIERGDAIYRRTGRWPYPIFTAARLQWLAAEEPDLFSRITTVLSIDEWLAAELCGERTAEATQAGETLLFDLETRNWADDLVEELQLPRNVLPPLASAGDRLGSLLPGAAERFGLRAGTAVAVGGGDTQCGLLGAGAIAPGDVVAVAGTTGPIQMVTDRPIRDDEARLWTGHHLMPGRWVLESNCGPLGEALDWLARVLYPGSPHAVVRLFAEADTSEPGARGLLSSLGAEVMNAKSLGLPVGQLTLSHLTSIDDDTPRRHVTRSVVEGLACSLRANLEQITDLAGAPNRGLRMTGGLSRSDSFLRIVSGVLGSNVEATEQPGASALGAALCASVGAGLFPDLEAAATTLVRMKPAPVPEPDHTEAYDSLYTRWNSLRAARSAADTEAATLTMPFVIAAGQHTDAADRERPRPRVLVTADFDDRSIDALQDLGEVEYASFRQAKRMLTGPALVEALSGFDVFITEIDLVDVASLEELTDLRVVGTCRGDAVNVDIEACSAFGIPVLNAPGRNADSVADLTIGFMLMLARKFPPAGTFLREPGIRPGDMGAMGKAFATLQGRELWRKTIGLHETIANAGATLRADDRPVIFTLRRVWAGVGLAAAACLVVVLIPMMDRGDMGRDVVFEDSTPPGPTIFADSAGRADMDDGLARGSASSPAVAGGLPAKDERFGGGGGLKAGEEQVAQFDALGAVDAVEAEAPGVGGRGGGKEQDRRLRGHAINEKVATRQPREEAQPKPDAVRKSVPNRAQPRQSAPAPASAPVEGRRNGPPKKRLPPGASTGAGAAPTAPPAEPPARVSAFDTRPVERVMHESSNESYGALVDNPFLRASDAPLSTFSIDVDTASYSNVRRLLGQGKLPPKDAVRIEEMINYFDYAYEPATGERAVLGERRTPRTARGTPKHRAACASACKRPHRSRSDMRPATSLVFLLDVSGSMNQREQAPAA